MCHVAHLFEFLGSVHVRVTWNYLQECLRAHYVENICRSVYVRTTWNTFVAQMG